MPNKPILKSNRNERLDCPHIEACISRDKAYSGLPYARKRSSDDYLQSEIFSLKGLVRHLPGYVSSGFTVDEIELALDSPVMPSGAAKLTELYRRGLLYTSGKKPGQVQQWLIDYAAASESDVMNRSKALWIRDFEAADQAEATRLALSQVERAQLRNLAAFQEPEFTYALLDAIFWENIGKGYGELVIGGIQVRKSVLTYTSNSGKSRSSEVEFTWVSPSGELKSLLKESRYAGNRRNDADRDWGLPD